MDWGIRRLSKGWIKSSIGWRLREHYFKGVHENFLNPFIGLLSSRKTIPEALKLVLWRETQSIYGKEVSKI